jgi:small subunit ribosomal protein S5
MDRDKSPQDKRAGGRSKPMSPEEAASRAKDNIDAATAAREDGEWKEKVIQIRRVTKVVKGGKKLSFRAVVVIGNGAGQVGLGIGKSNEVIGAIQKGIAAARKALIKVPIFKTTIPHPIRAKFGGSQVVLLPASEGTGIIAGGSARVVLELAGIGNILSKSLGSNSPLNVAQATIESLNGLRTFKDIARNRGMSVKDMLHLNQA